MVEVHPARKGRGLAGLSRHVAFIPAFVLIGLFCTGAVLSLSPAFESDNEKFQRAVYESDRTIFTTYFYWYRASNTLQGSQQVIYDLKPEAVETIRANLANPPAGWPGPTLENIDEIISFNATGDGKNYTNAISHHPPALAPAYDARGEVIGELDRSLAKFSTDQNGVIVNLTSWFDWTSPAWHEWEMRCMMRAGIDVAMPVYWWTGPESNIGYWAHEGLVVLNDTITALQAKVANESVAGGSYTPGDVPKLAMFYDTTLMRQLWAWNVTQDNASIYFNNTNAFNEGPGADLTDPYWEHQFYLRIQEFFDVIINGSAVYVVNLDVDGVQGEYCVVWLYGGGWFETVGPDVFDYCRAKFEARYGKKVLFVGGGEWNVAGLDGECGWGACCGLRLATNGRIPAGGFGPGYYNIGTLICQSASYTPRDVPRYTAGLRSVIDSGAAWIHVETWNELLEGTDICWSQQHGYDFIDATREIADVFHAMEGPLPLHMRSNLLLVVLPLSGLVFLVGMAFVLQRRQPTEDV